MAEKIAGKFIMELDLKVDNTKANKKTLEENLKNHQNQLKKQNSMEVKNAKKQGGTIAKETTKSAKKQAKKQGGSPIIAIVKQGLADLRANPLIGGILGAVGTAVAGIGGKFLTLNPTEALTNVRTQTGGALQRQELSEVTGISSTRLKNLEDAFSRLGLSGGQALATTESFARQGFANPIQALENAINQGVGKGILTQDVLAETYGIDKAVFRRLVSARGRGALDLQDGTTTAKGEKVLSNEEIKQNLNDANDNLFKYNAVVGKLLNDSKQFEKDYAVFREVINDRYQESLDILTTSTAGFRASNEILMAWNTSVDLSRESIEEFTTKLKNVFKDAQDVRNKNIKSDINNSNIYAYTASVSASQPTQETSTYSYLTGTRVTKKNINGVR